MSRKKSQKVSDDVSPLTQGLRYRAACDSFAMLQKYDFHDGPYYNHMWVIRPTSYFVKNNLLQLYETSFGPVVSSNVKLLVEANTYNT